MSAAVLMAILQSGVVPEIMAFIRDRFTATGKLPTDAQVIDRLVVLAASVITKGEDYLATHPKEVQP
jgi:fucose permease